MSRVLLFTVKTAAGIGAETKTPKSTIPKATFQALFFLKWCEPWSERCLFQLFVMWPSR